MSGESAYAAAPFAHEKADIILRSPDNIDFCVFKLFLSLASPTFEAMFEIPQSTEASNDQELKDGVAVIRVQENSKTLDILLRFCYPCTLAEDPTLEVLQDLIDVLKAARRYSLDIVERKVRQALSSPKFLESDPLRCFAIAHWGRAREETLLAAKYTLTQPLIPSWFREIDLISAADLLALLTYHQKCGDAVYAMGNDMSWIQSHYKSSQGCPWLQVSTNKNPKSRDDDTWVPTRSRDSNRSETSSCRCEKSTVTGYQLFKTYPLKWWEDFMVETFAALRDKPCSATVESSAAKTVQGVRGQGCPTCSVNVAGNIRDFSELLIRKVDEVVSKIEMVLEL